MKSIVFLDEGMQAMLEKQIYTQIENAIREQDSEAVERLCQMADNLDLTREEGHLGIMAVNNIDILKYLTNKAPELIEKYGVDILTAAVWVHNKEAVMFLAQEKHVDYSSLDGTNVYEYCTKMLGDEGHHNIVEGC